MEFCKKLLTKNFEGSIEETLATIKSREYIADLYLICVPEKSGRIMEIVHSREIYKDYYESIPYFVIALAYGKANAKELSAEITAEYVKTGLADSKSFNEWARGEFA